MNMSNDNYISDFKLNEIRKEYGGKIVSFSSVERSIKEWYLYFDLPYPLSSVNNYRDSWFHYRKIWRERSLYEVTCQMATFDEHLQRAEKDAIINILQIISQALQYWYQIEQEEIPEHFINCIKQNIKTARANCTPEERKNKQWVIEMWGKFEENEQEAAYALIYAAQKHILKSQSILRQIQKLLHTIKNTTLRIRLGASDIHRIEYPGEYLDLCSQCYDEVFSFFEKEENRVLFFLVGMTNVVKAITDGYKLSSEKSRS